MFVRDRYSLPYSFCHILNVSVSDARLIVWKTINRANRLVHYTIISETLINRLISRNNQLIDLNAIVASERSLLKQKRKIIRELFIIPSEN